MLTFFYLPIQDLWGDPQDDRGVKRGDYLPPHKHINNSSDYGTNPTEQLLNASRPQTSKKCKAISLERGRTKDKDIKETKNFRTGLVGGVGLGPEGGKESVEKEEMFPLTRKLPLGQGGATEPQNVLQQWGLRGQNNRFRKFAKMSKVYIYLVLYSISPGCSLEGLMLKLKLQYPGHLMQIADSFGKPLMLGKIEGRRRRG